MNQTAPRGSTLKPIDQFRNILTRMEGELWKVLPSQIKPDKFTRIIMTAVQTNPDLLACTQQSLLNACMAAAKDGLLPDGREGAIVPYGENQDGVKQSDRAAWIPMVAGIRAKILRSGEVIDLRVREVREGDEFDYVEGDDPHLFHRPLLIGGHSDRPIRYIYSIAKFKEGDLSRYVMTIEQIEEIRQKFSKSKKGPWNNPITYVEMAKKTVLRRHAKELPQCTDLTDIVHRDDELFDLQKEQRTVRRQLPAGAPPATATAALADFGEAGRQRRQPAPPAPPPEPPEDGPLIEHDADGVIHDEVPEQPTETYEQAITRLMGPPGALKTPDDVKALAKAVMNAANAPEDGDVAQRWWASEIMKKNRTRCGVDVATTQGITAELEEMASALRQQ